ncbi:MAG: DUF2971 domain-containing protein [Kiritimatiellae bacterium]|nr:DUF2971 domain-containing protein [Kiritimatiellia bacterium]MDD5519495.1 DUF2971 domain-containing protein [Kiritimatiellia bacterium]
MGLIHNILNFTDSEKSKNIYRIMPVYRLLEMFVTKKLTLSKPCKWDDPFENFILKGQGVSITGRSFSFGSRDFVYGQCWSLNKETDAMWRIYSHDKNGVKVRTQIRKLLRSVQNSDVRYPHSSLFIGKVCYKTEQEIEEFASASFDKSSESIAKSLLIKRKAFEPENEVRLIYHDINRSSTGDVVQFVFDPLEVIDEIVFDSRMDEHLYSVFSAWFKERNFSGSLYQSKLYKPPQRFIVRITES